MIDIHYAQKNLKINTDFKNKENFLKKCITNSDPGKNPPKNKNFA